MIQYPWNISNGYSLLDPKYSRKSNKDIEIFTTPAEEFLWKFFRFRDRGKRSTIKRLKWYYKQ